MYSRVLWLFLLVNQCAWPLDGMLAPCCGITCSFLWTLPCEGQAPWQLNTVKTLGEDTEATVSLNASLEPSVLGHEKCPVSHLPHITAHEVMSNHREAACTLLCVDWWLFLITDWMHRHRVLNACCEGPPSFLSPMGGGGPKHCVGGPLSCGFSNEFQSFPEDELSFLLPG